MAKLRVDPNAWQWPNWIGNTVVKKSGKPFKSGSSIATVKALTVNPYTALPAFTFNEDDSVVECRAVVVLEFVFKREEEELHLKVGGRYNWKNQPERLIYIGLCEPRNGRWHQFEKVGVPGDVWCEVLDADLHMLEETGEN